MEHSDNFLKWLKDSNAFISPKIAIKDYSGEGARLGAVAVDDIKVLNTIFYALNLIISVCRRMKCYSRSLVLVYFPDPHLNIAIRSGNIVKRLDGSR